MQIRNGSWVDPDLGNETVEFYANQFLERRRKRNKNKNTTDTYDTHIRVHIIPFLGKHIAKTLRRKHSMALVDYLIDQPTVGGIYGVQIFKTWRILVNYMIDEDVPLPANIVSRIELPDVEERVKVSLSPEQVNRLAAAMRQVEPRFEVFVWIAACAGLREGEAIGLKKTSVEWSEGLLYVEEQRQGGKATKLKTKASAATLPVDAFLIEKLKEHIERFPQLAPVSRRTERDRQRRGWTPPPDEGLIVTNRYGRPVSSRDFNEKWRTAVRIAGLPPETRFHDLKHFYTSQLGASGRHDPKTVQALSRHARFSETWETYAHPPRAVEGVTVTTFSGLFAPSDTSEERAA